jgi:phosphatidylglycerol---prolipoprotein diacylglyceryl transferase
MLSNPRSDAFRNHCYEAFAEAAIFGILYWRFRKPHQRGVVISLYMMLYGTTRFLVEFVRNHGQGNLWGGPLDTSQWISLALVGLGIAWQVEGKKAQPAPAAV